MPGCCRYIKFQLGQGMTEYVVVLMFGVMVLTIGPGGDVLLDLLAVINDNHQGYSYSVSLSTLPQYDSLADYVLATNGDDITAVENKLKALYNLVPNSPTFAMPAAIPPSLSSICSITPPC